MNAKKRKEINRREAYEVLKLLKNGGYWDPVSTAFMPDNQCISKLSKIIAEYFKTNKNLIFWNANSYLDGIAENKEIALMMQHYEFNKYEESLEL